MKIPFAATVLLAISMLFVAAPCDAYLPVVMMHGIDGSAKDFSPMVQLFLSFLHVSLKHLS